MVKWRARTVAMPSLEAVGDATPPRPSLKRRAARWLGWTILVQIGGCLWLWPHAEAAVGEKLAGLGEQLLRVSSATHQDRPRTLWLNGQALRLSSGSSKLGIAAVLGPIEAQCRRRSGRLAQAAQGLGARAAAYLKQLPKSLLDFSVRVDGDDQGVVACLDLGDQTLSLAEMFRRVQRFLDQGDLKELGELRYVYAKRAGGSTAFLTVWNEGSLPLQRMFPLHGDAPGSDFVGIPRPPQGRRLLSVREAGVPYGMVIYEHRLSPNAASDFYRRQLSKADWQLFDAAGPGANDRSAQVLSAERGAESLWIITGGPNGSRRHNFAALVRATAP